MGSVRSRADREVDRPGRLGQEPANRVTQQALDRFAQLRAVARGERGQAAGAGNARRALSELPDVGTLQTPPLNREIDARIRLVANRNRARPEVEPEPQAAVPREAATAAEPAVAQAADQAPTAVEISRANTTEEIRENLQENTREVERGLRRDADQQARVNTRQTARAAAQAGEARREREIGSNEAATRELRTEERRLEQELVQTQREIRNLGNRTNRIQGPANRSTSATAAAIGTQVDLLVG